MRLRLPSNFSHSLWRVPVGSYQTLVGRSHFAQWVLGLETRKSPLDGNGIGSRPRHRCFIRGSRAATSKELGERGRYSSILGIHECGFGCSPMGAPVYVYLESPLIRE